MGANCAGVGGGAPPPPPPPPPDARNVETVGRLR